VAVLRFSRDKRGYEHFYLVEPTGRREKSQQKILYWFRTPPGVRVGRAPFDDEIRRALEEQNPGVSFDWQKLLAVPIPPPAPDVEKWRERRKAERAAKQAAREEAAAAVAAEDAAAAETAGGHATEALLEASQDQPGRTADDQSGSPPSAAAGAESGPPGRRRRRRRRGGRQAARDGSDAADTPSVPAQGDNRDTPGDE
jgi:hypothetical protein